MTLNYNEQREARRKALRLLEHMDRTEKGLRDRLIQGGFSEEAAEDAVAYVKDYGYINDYRYALNYILYRIHSKSRRESAGMWHLKPGKKPATWKNRMRPAFSGPP